MVEQETRPLVVCDDTGNPVDVVLQNRKGYTKSVETGTLWSIHPRTGRLLPYPGGTGAVVEDRGAWVKATLPGERAAPETAPDNAAARDDRVPDRAQGVSGSASGNPLGQTLSDLADLIRARHHEMPDGSYTTHLFESGTSKIRKKVGEEAVEILLARGPELISETADFLYHLLVLLEAEGVTLEQISAELRKR